MWIPAFGVTNRWRQKAQANATRFLLKLMVRLRDRQEQHDGSASVVVGGRRAHPSGRRTKQEYYSSTICGDVGNSWRVRGKTDEP